MAERQGLRAGRGKVVRREATVATNGDGSFGDALQATGRRLRVFRPD